MCLLITLPLQAQNITSLKASLTPTVIIDGPVGSMQQVQYITNLADSNWTTLSFVRLTRSHQPFYDSTASGDSKRFYRTVLLNLEDTNLVWIPPGSFTMGSPTNEEYRDSLIEGQVQVTLTKGFFMARYETRNIEWLGTVGDFPIWVTAGAAPRDTNLVNYLQRPVRYVSQGEANDYCALRTTNELAAGRIPSGWAYRLPTEAEWEYACRAGSTTVFSYGNQLRNDEIRQDASFAGNAPYPPSLVPINPVIPNIPQPVGMYPPNAFGLYDMHGNVRELCLDSYTTVEGHPPPLSGGEDPFTTGGSQSIVRGGGFTDPAVDCRSARRRLGAEFAYNPARGFRVVLAPVPGP